MNQPEPTPSPPLGLMCGTFDPPHNGHLTLAKTAANQLNLAQILFIPVGQPTHKTTLTPAHHRLAMTQLAITGRQNFILDTTDIDRPPPHYTATLLPLLQEKYAGHPLWLLIGGDSLRDFASWHNPQAILNSGCHIAVLERPHAHIDWPALEAQLPHIRTKITMLNGPLLDISSTALRHHSERHTLPAAVDHYINKHNLYVGRS